MKNFNEEDIKFVLDNILTNSQKELESISNNEELERFWFFKYDAELNPATNLYVFIGMLDLYKRKCRQWEETHNGSACVVERVRDTYLMPKIKQFLLHMSEQ